MMVKLHGGIMVVKLQLTDLISNPRGWKIRTNQFSTYLLIIVALRQPSVARKRIFLTGGNIFNVDLGEMPSRSETFRKKLIFF